MAAHSAALNDALQTDTQFEFTSQFSAVAGNLREQMNSILGPAIAYMRAGDILCTVSYLPRC